MCEQPCNADEHVEQGDRGMEGEERLLPSRQETSGVLPDCLPMHSDLQVTNESEARAASISSFVV